MRDNNYTKNELKKTYDYYKLSAKQVRNTNQSERLNNIAKVVNSLLKGRTPQQIKDGKMKDKDKGIFNSYMKQIDIHIKYNIRPQKAKAF